MEKHSGSNSNARAYREENTIACSRLEALVHGQAAVLEMIARGAPLSVILEEIVYWVEKQSTERLFASILLLDKKGQHLVHGAAPSLPDSYNKAINGIKIGPDVGSCGTAAFTRQMVIVDDIATDPLWKNYRKLALDSGLKACWSTPLLTKDNTVVGTFAIYYPDPRKPTEDDIQIIKLVTHTVTIAIQYKLSEEENNLLQEKERQALARVKHERQYFYSVLMNAPAAIAVLNGPQHVFELANLLYMETVGKTRNIIGKPVREALPELKGHEVFDMLDNVYRTGNSVKGNELLLQLDREGNGKLEDYYFNFIYQPIRNNGVIEGVFAHAVDVTELVQARKLAEESEAQFRNLIMEAPMATALYTGREMKVELANEAMIKLWGKDASVTGKTLKEALPELEGQPFLPLLDKVYTTGVPYHTEEQPADLVVDGKLQTFWFNFTYKPVKDVRGNTLGILNMAVDITSQIKAKEEYKKLQRQKDEFLAIASHELKTPVTSIKAYAQMLEGLFRESGNIQEATMLAKMDKQVNKLTDLIGDLLEATRINSGKLRFHEDHFDLDALAEEVIEEMERTSGKHTIIRQLNAGGMIYGDRTRIGQVITNMVSNAMKYSPGTSRIIVSTWQEPGSVTLSVRDFGVGIPEDKLDKVFEQFYRVNNSKHQPSGLGLGLYISSKIIKRLGGKIWVESEQGKGSTFYFTLPRDHRTISE